jgi:hypothetical protein
LSLLLLSAWLLEHMCFCKNLKGDLIFLQQWSGLNIETSIAWNLCFQSSKTFKVLVVVEIIYVQHRCCTEGLMTLIDFVKK